MTDCTGCGQENLSAVSAWCDYCRSAEARDIAHIERYRHFRSRWITPLSPATQEAERLARWRRRSHR